MAEDTQVVSVESTSVVTTEAPLSTAVVSSVEQRNIVVDSCEAVAVSVEDDVFVLATEERLSVVAAGSQGPPGPPGIGTTATQYVASTALSGHRMVLLDTNHQAAYASNEVLGHGVRVLGLTTGAALGGDLVEVAWNCEVQEPSWNWVVGGAIYLGANGALVQSAPVSPALFSLCVGFATATNRMFISVGAPIILA